MALLEDRKSRKSKGIHYTPTGLADFLARRLWSNFRSDFESVDRPLAVLDPACGDGALLVALAKRMPERQITAFGFDTDSQAVAQTKVNLLPYQNCQLHIQNQDFLDFALNQDEPAFDIAITNPPYVRTQLLGQEQSQRLAVKFGLTGRVDLYQAFLFAITKMLRQGGWIGALTSNRFLYTQAGKSTRNLLRSEFDITELYDLGDTRLFQAAVLPAVFVATKLQRCAQVSMCTVANSKNATKFVRIEQSHEIEAQDDPGGIFEAIENAPLGIVSSFSHSGIQYSIESGTLNVDDHAHSWRLENPDSQSWLNRLSQKQNMTIGDVAEVKVGIKTTADSVFIRDDWHELPADIRPEQKLLRPLVTHKSAQRWVGRTPTTQVLYPYENETTRIPVQLQSFPNGKAYLKKHFARLSSRKYLVDAGRKWFEIWVPQRATDWQSPKIVWPEISELPKFFLDASGSVVNGDCYWIKLKQDQPFDLLYLILAVANSNIALRFYDHRFHNKLYGRRRRFMTQYVKQFPLPDLERPVSQAIVDEVKAVLNSTDAKERATLERGTDALVHQAFGLESTLIESTNSP